MTLIRNSNSFKLVKYTVTEMAIKWVKLYSAIKYRHNLVKSKPNKLLSDILLDCGTCRI